MTAPMVIDGAMNGEAFRAYVRHMLAPSLQAGDVVIMDNLPAHKVGGGVREIIEGGRRAAALPPALFSGLQPDRAGFRQAQGLSSQGRRTNPRRPRIRHRRRPRRLCPRRMRQLIHRRGLRTGMIGICSRYEAPAATDGRLAAMTAGSAVGARDLGSVVLCVAARPETALRDVRGRDAGVVDRGGLENRCGGDPTQGSNPCLSAIFSR